MTDFYPRLTPPKEDDLNWINVSRGGKNKCILINDKTGSVLPNCTGYAWGRTYELNRTMPRLSVGNAGNWYNYNDGYSRGKNPRLGAIACFKDKSGGAGHVAVVEEINPDGSIRTSNSAYGGKRFYLQTLYPPFDNDNYEFQGFIYSYSGFRDLKKKKFNWVLFTRVIRNRKSR